MYHRQFGSVVLLVAIGCSSATDSSTPTANQDGSSTPTADAGLTMVKLDVPGIT